MNVERDWSVLTSSVEYGLSKLGYMSLKAQQMRAVESVLKGKDIFVTDRTDRTDDRVVGLPRSSSSLNLWLGGRSCAEQAAHATALPRLRPCPAACAAFHAYTCKLAVCYAKRFTYTPTVMNTNNIC